MAHVVPAEGDTVAVVTPDGDELEGTVQEAAGHHAVVDLGDGEEVSAFHTSAIGESDYAWERRVTATADDEGEDEEADESEETAESEAPIDPSTLTVEEVREAVAEAEDVDALHTALDIEGDADDPRSTAIEAIEERIEDLEGGE